MVRARHLPALGALAFITLLVGCSGSDEAGSPPAPSTPTTQTATAPASTSPSQTETLQPERPGYHPLELATGIATPIGDGAKQVWVLQPFGDARSIVIFLHGWTATLPVQWHQPWLEHLMDEGSIVLFPRYQHGSAGEPRSLTVEAMREGLAAGISDLGNPDLPVVVAGFSHGGSLAFYYAANARKWGLPVPAAVYSIFPTGPPGVPLPEKPPPDSVKVLVLAGEQDYVVGTEGADTFWEWLDALPENTKEYRIIRSTPELPAYHEAVKRMPAAIDTFWAPLDQLIADARSTTSS